MSALDPEITVVYEDAVAGWLTATIPALPGPISWGRTQAEARSTSSIRSAQCFRSSPRTPGPRNG